MAKPVKRRMSKQDQEDWDELYEYVRTNVLGYDKNQSLSREMVLRLKGLLTNKFMENNNVKDTANYSFKTILITFKFCMPDIQKALATHSFNDEQHKFNYILRIVESNINTVYMRMKNMKKAEEKTKALELSAAKYSGATYKKKTTEPPSGLDDLW